MEYFGRDTIQAASFRVTAVAAPIVSLAELKAHLGIYENDFDSQLENMVIPAATQIVNNIIGEFTESSTIAAYYNDFSTRMALPHNYVNAISSITYFDTEHQSQTLDASLYVFDANQQQPEVVLIGDIPETSDRFRNPITITYTTQLMETSIEIAALQQATLLVCGDLWNDRSNSVEGARSRATMTADRILGPYKRVCV